MSSDALGAALLAAARNAIGERLHIAPSPPSPKPPPPAELAQPAATFVTLTRKGQLRGCIGSLQAYRPLAVDVAENAVAAAFRDPRFPPLSAEEFASTRVEVSLLSAAEPLSFTDEADALARLRPHVDGIILTHGHRRATFLPQVWEQLPKPADFMRQLKLKAGLSADFWDEHIRLARYGVQKWKEA